MTSRSQITMDSGLQRRARQRAAELGLSFAEYVRRAVLRDLGEKQPKPDVSILFNLVDDGPPSDIARDKDRMLAEAALREHRRKKQQAAQRRPATAASQSRRD
ncbi:MAG TPA: hypothetical protein VHY79_09435 [Rhizomicrobium sp.]|nr:hypothetical protein [Rhizomicrobium sp.]